MIYKRIVEICNSFPEVIQAGFQGFRSMIGERIFQGDKQLGFSIVKYRKNNEQSSKSHALRFVESSMIRAGAGSNETHGHLPIRDSCLQWLVWRI